MIINRNTREGLQLVCVCPPLPYKDQSYPERAVCGVLRWPFQVEAGLGLWPSRKQDLCVRDLILIKHHTAGTVVRGDTGHSFALKPKPEPLRDKR